MTPPAPSAVASPNPFLLGLWRGARGRCPNCGEGRLFRAYLKVAPQCAACGHDNAQYRADDAGPYFTILLVGHLVVGPMLFFPFIWRAPIGWALGVTMPTVAGLTLLLLPVVKGSVVGVLWSMNRNRREGDSPAGVAPEPQAETWGA